VWNVEEGEETAVRAFAQVLKEASQGR